MIRHTDHHLRWLDVEMLFQHLFACVGNEIVCHSAFDETGGNSVVRNEAARKIKNFVHSKVEELPGRALCELLFLPIAKCRLECVCDKVEKALGHGALQRQRIELEVPG